LIGLLPGKILFELVVVIGRLQGLYLFATVGCFRRIGIVVSVVLLARETIKPSEYYGFDVLNGICTGFSSAFIREKKLNKMEFVPGVKDNVDCGKVTHFLPAFIVLFLHWGDHVDNMWWAFCNGLLEMLVDLLHFLVQVMHSWKASHSKL
jgi:hypothetical protein